MKHLYFVASLVITNFCVSVNAIAQQLRDTKALSNGSIYYADLIDAKIANKNAIFADLLKISPENNLKSERTHIDNVGIKHDYHQQYYKGIKVESGSYTLHSKDNNYQHISGNFEKIENLTVNATITEKTALQKVLSAVGAKEYAWQNVEAEKFIKDLKQNPKESYLPKAELLIVRNWDLFEKTGEIKHHLCYAFYIRATQPDLDLRVYIDAQTGEIIAQKNMVCYADGIADTRYSGRVSIKTEQVATGYRLRDTENNIITLNALGRTDATGIDFIDGNNSWTEYNNAAKDNSALDAHFGATKAVQYWKNTHNRQSFDNTNTPLKQLVHAKTPDGASGTTENASWTQSEKVVRYGDGGIVYKPLTALDWVAHETGHAYSYGLGFDYIGNTDNADLHEGLSDIWAMCIDRDDWQFGDQVQNNGKSCTRSIENPTLSTAAFQGASTYQSATYNAIPSYHPHGRGLVLAHWFYILSEGKTGTNELGRSYSVVGISKEMAEQIVYGMYPYLNTTGWASVANAAKQSAKTRYGACSQQYISVVNALYAVGLETQMISIPTLQFTQGTAIICDNSTGSFSVQVSAPTSSYRWELPASLGVSFANGSNTIDTSTPNVNVNVNFAALGSNYVSANYIPLKVSVACPYDPNVRITQTYLFWAGKPQVPPIVPQTAQACLGQTYTVIADGGFAAEDYVWQTTTPTKLVLTNMSYYNAATFQVVGIGTGIIRVGVRNRCTNTFAYRDYSVNIRPCLEFSIANLKEANTQKYFLYPNPASSTVNIGLEKTDNTLVSSEASTFTYKVYNSLGVLLYENTKDANNLETSFSVSSWADGIYTILIQTEQGTQALKLVVQKGKIAN